MAAKINMRLDKNEMPSQDPNVRNKNFLEVALGYTEEQALDEAARCLNCKNHPCVNGCPVNVRIPEFIAKIVERDYEGAYQVIHQTSSLPAVCGRVCPQESQCEMHCVRGKKGDPVGIGRLERFVADWHNAHSTEAPEKPQSNGHKVAVVGSGPAGLTCAGDLAKKGYEVTVYEALHLAGGVLVYGIPEFRLPKSIVQKEVDGLKAMGVKVETNIVVGRTNTIDELMEELREQGVTRIEDVKYAVLENSGQLTVFPWTAQQPPTAEQLGLGLEDDVTLPMVIINDGRVIHRNLTACGRDENWLRKQLSREKASSPREIFLLTLDEQGQVFCVRKERES